MSGPRPVPKLPWELGPWVFSNDGDFQRSWGIPICSKFYCHQNHLLIRDTSTHSWLVFQPVIHGVFFTWIIWRKSHQCIQKVDLLQLWKENCFFTYKNLISLQGTVGQLEFIDSPLFSSDYGGERFEIAMRPEWKQGQDLMTHGTVPSLASLFTKVSWAL